MTPPILRSTDFNLGQDTARMKDPRDAARQHATVDALLGRLFSSNPTRRREIQILADEVGMGKTFVALGVAYSTLAWMRSHSEQGDLAGCYQKVLIITPPNAALFSKWNREVAEFVKRCVKSSLTAESGHWFAPAEDGAGKPGVQRIDELVAQLRRTGTANRVIVADMSVFAGRKLEFYALKRRVLLGQLFRLWSNAFPRADRERLLKGAPWEGTSHDFDVVNDDERRRLHLQPEDTYAALQRFQAQTDSDGEKLIAKALELCKEIAAPYQRDRYEQFRKVEKVLNDLYRATCADAIRQAIPLVIVDEAHNWKNGPTHGANGYREFSRYVASRTRRVLLLTATPFQLRPDEMLEVLKISDSLAPSPTLDAASARREELRRIREREIRPVLDASARASMVFQKAWSRLPSSITTETLAAEWGSPAIVRARGSLLDHARDQGVAYPERIVAITKDAVIDVDPDRRQFIRDALQLYCYNSDLSTELGGLVIRHRRQTEHRLFMVGREHHRSYDPKRIIARPDRHVLHASPGLDVRGEGELPHYLLMRCVSEMKQGKGRSSLGTALTGCYSTLLHSAEGKGVQRQLGSTAAGMVYLDLLMKMVTEKHDVRHPKVDEVVEAVLRAWHAGEKTLIFCFRVNTAHRLRDIIRARIEAEIAARRSLCLGGEEKLRALRSRMTGRDRDLITIGLDRVLWSFYWARTFSDEARIFTADDLRLTDADLREIARLALTYGVDLEGDRVDRVFLHRATEHALARRLKRHSSLDRKWGRLVGAIADNNESWVTHPYGLTQDEPTHESAADSTDRVSFDERGAHTVYRRRKEPDPAEVDRVAHDISERRANANRRQQLSIFDMYARGPSLWFGKEPERIESDDPVAARRTIEDLHTHLATLSTDGEGFAWRSRLEVLAAMRRALLRESVLVRLLPDQERDDDGIGVLLAEAFFAPLPGQRECMADRVAVYLEDLSAASGSMFKPGSSRQVLLDATRLRDERHVALVEGGMDAEDKERIFAGFNTPLLPEVLICTSVGQEGIDLHRHCRHVIHYDLAWNPAVLEQRTGRADRIGSKTFRERDLRRPEEEQVHLEIGVPFLAGTYDERMYEELRLRAQTFEVLTGGDFAVENAEGNEDAEGKAGDGAPNIVVLPRALVEDLRVSLHVWREAS